MNRNLQSARQLASALLVSAVLAGCATAPNASSQDLPQRIEAALASSEHEALIAYYKGQAAAARAKVAEHRRMAKSYQANPSDGTAGAGMVAHCDSIVHMYEGIAAEYDGMADYHRLLANEPALNKK